jgi:HlyD family secretion protein
VQKGTVLLELSSADARRQLDLQTQSLESARWVTQEACAAASLAERDLARTLQMARDDLVSRQAIDTAQSRRDTAAASCEGATARQAWAAANVSLAREGLAKTVLRAPFPGTVAKVDTEVGEWLTPSLPGTVLPAVIELIDTQSIYVRAPLDETDLGKVKPGLPVRITLDAYPGRSFPGRLTYVSSYVSEVQQQNRTFDVDAEFDDPAFARTVPPGTSADVEILLSVRDDVVRIPTSAILQGGRVLAVRDGTLVGVPVKTGVANWQYSEVVDGLQVGDRVVVSLDRTEVREGARVRVESGAGK